MLSAVTVSLVPAARGGPFVFWDDLPAACRQASELGFDAVELFLPGPDAIEPGQLRSLLDEHKLKVAAVGTGAGWVMHKLTLCDSEAAIRRRAIDFIAAMIDFGGSFGAPAIIGSMQGRHSEAVPREQAMAHLTEALATLGNRAKQYGIPLIYEPLNRYETNLATTVADGVNLLDHAGLENVRLLADLFHMNIEEADVPAAIRAGGKRLGHVHFVDSNRRAAGLGHTDFTQIAAALVEIDYRGYLSAEAFPLPAPLEAAKQTIETYRALFPTS
jgi:sugar phosphate isomerase/epimerase